MDKIYKCKNQKLPAKKVEKSISIGVGVDRPVMFLRLDDDYKLFISIIVKRVAKQLLDKYF